jgi:uncharacterized damage-inducible protein DinB
MSSIDHVRLMANYNGWMNARLYAAAGRLDASALREDRGAFFRSILGTLNHLVVADIIWMQRFATHPTARPALETVAGMATPTALDQILADDLGRLREVRDGLDRAITAFCDAIGEADLDAVLTYARTDGAAQRKRLGPLLSHFFNHQTHHRGQVTTMLSQAGVDVGVTDLNALIPSLD